MKRDKDDKRCLTTVDGSPSLLGKFRSSIPGFPPTKVVMPVKKTTDTVEGLTVVDTKPQAPSSDLVPNSSLGRGAIESTTTIKATSDDPMAGIPPLQRMAMEAEIKHREEETSNRFNKGGTEVAAVVAGMMGEIEGMSMVGA